MSLHELLADYRAKHADPRNLRIHAVTVPIGAVGLLLLAYSSLAALAGFLTGSQAATLGVVGLSGFLLAAILQGIGHRREAVQSTFAGPHDVAWRLVREQLVLAPIFWLGPLRGHRG